MTLPAQPQWQRRCELLLFEPQRTNNPSAFTAGGVGPTVMDLSEMHIRFECKQEDEESPNNCSIRVENLSADTAQRVQTEYTRVVLQAGYMNAGFGVVFDGTIKQFRKGRTDSRTTYLEILAADGDLAYNYATLSRTLAAGSTPQERVQAVMAAMQPHGIQPGQVEIPGTGGVLPRGKVLFGLARAALRQIVRDRGCTWSIQNGAVNIVPLDSYLPDEAVVLTSETGLIGRPEQTENGVVARCLINPRIQVGGLVKIDNRSVNQTIQQNDFALPFGQQPFDRYAGVQLLADVAADGLYRVYVAEMVGDTRGQEWYMDLSLLAVDPSTGKVTAK